jgi:hypothetical protein
LSPPTPRKARCPSGHTTASLRSRTATGGPAALKASHGRARKWCTNCVPAKGTNTQPQEAQFRSVTDFSRIHRSGARLARTPQFDRALLSSLGYPNRRSSRRSRVSAALRRNQSSISAIATNFNRPRRTHRSSMCLSKKSQLHPTPAPPRSASEPGAVGGEHVRAFASAPPIWRLVTRPRLSRARE